MRKTFDAELQELNYEMIDMAAAAEDAIDVVTESLASGDDAAALNQNRNGGSTNETTFSIPDRRMERRAGC